jgi:hypothetical protein
MKQSKAIFRFFLFPLVFALAFMLAQFREGTALSNPDESRPTPTIDRLSEPPMPVNPEQADYGAKEYWFQCMPCHGDQGQGLTDEFRQLYPPEDRNCWNSGCHGPRPYEGGWTIPDSVPVVIGENALQKFPNAFILQAYIKATMPYQWPGTLDDETAWKLTAFLLRENGLWQGNQALTADNALTVVIAPPQSPSMPPARPELQPVATVLADPAPSASGELVTLIVLLLLLAGAVFVLRFVKNV